MANWIQLKDNVAFAYIQSSNFVENSILIEDDINPKDIMGKKNEDGQWVDAELIYFVEESFNNTVLRVNSTVFSSDVTGPICPNNVNPHWTINGDGTFSPPASIVDATIYDEHLFT
jgi:hypothetical protein